jgi:hypothetical protein
MTKFLRKNFYPLRNAGLVHAYYNEFRSGTRQMSKPVKLLLACVLCLGVIAVVGLLIQAYA